MSWTKARLVSQAFGAFGLQGFAFPIAPEMTEFAVNTLDAMLASWGTEFGIRIGYNNGANDATAATPEDDSGIPDHANEAVYLGLADRLADMIGKTLSARMNQRRQDAFDQLLSWAMASSLPEMQLRPATPVGSGNAPFSTGFGQVFVGGPADQLSTGAGDGFIDGNNGTPFIVEGGGAEE